jgi:hypothetical protein
MTPEERESLRNDVEKFYKRRDRSTKMWSALSHGSLFLSAIFSALAALVLKLKSLEGSPYQSDISAALAVAAAVLTTLTAVGSFHRKWRVNRTSRSGLEQLRVELSDPNTDGGRVRTRLKEIIQKHDEGIIGPEG